MQIVFFLFHAQKLVIVKKPGFFDIRKQYYEKHPISKFKIVVLGTLKFFVTFSFFTQCHIFSKFRFFRIHKA